MSFRGKFVIILLSAIIAVYAVSGGFLRNFAQQPINDAGAQMRIFESVLQHIQNDYVDVPNLDKVRNGAMRGLAYGLDPFSAYLTAEQVKAFKENKQNNLVGIGAEFSQISGYLYVISVIKGSPAEKAGLKAGDVIEYVETKATRDISLYDARQMILGENGSNVNLRVLRAGEKAQTITVTRGNYTIPMAESKIEAGRIGVVKVFSLEKGEAADIRSKVQDLIKQNVQKIVLDLRGVAAGDLNEAVEVANLFIKEGELAKVIGRENKVLQTFTADANKHLFGGQMAVLIDLGTAGPGEIVAGAILDRKRGEVVGERSFGAGTKQELFTLRGGDGFLLTVAKWASPNGNPFLAEERSKSGIMPTVEVKRPDTPEAVEVEELIDQNQQQNQQPQPNTTPNMQKTEAPKTLEDLQLKKALEILQAVK